MPYLCYKYTNFSLCTSIFVFFFFSIKQERELPKNLNKSIDSIKLASSRKRKNLLRCNTSYEGSMLQTFLFFPRANYICTLQSYHDSQKYE